MAQTTPAATALGEATTSEHDMSRTPPSDLLAVEVARDTAGEIALAASGSDHSDKVRQEARIRRLEEQQAEIQKVLAVVEDLLRANREAVARIGNS